MSTLFIDPASLPQGIAGLLQTFFLAAVYGYVLCHASDLISSGSELLLLVPSVAGIVGSILLPILGAVPDAAIILASGLGNNAQEQLSVGVGALAGSTIMLLTVPWFLSVVGGRVDISPSDGMPRYKRPAAATAVAWKKLTPGNRSLTRSGVVGGEFVRRTGLVMLTTGIGYLIILIPAIYAEKMTPHNLAEQGSRERIYSGLGIIFCFFAFVWYLYYQWTMAAEDNHVELKALTNEVRVEAVKKQLLSAKAIIHSLLREAERRESAALVAVPASFGIETSQHSTSLLGTRISENNKKVLSAVGGLLKPFFDRLDRDKNGHLSREEVRILLHELHESPTEEELQQFFSGMDLDSSGFVEFEEFVLAMIKFAQLPPMSREPSNTGDSVRKLVRGRSRSKLDALDEEEENEADMPEDLAKLPPETQQFRLKLRSLWMMGIGTGLVLLFADPMVDVLADLGRRTSVPAFYISFTVAPFASNASELITAYNYSLKKTQNTVTISFCTLLGATCMNNTVCLGVFLVLVYYRHLAWTFTAETLMILLVQWVMVLVSQKTVHRLIDGFFVLTLYPLSLLLVMLLKNEAGLD